MFFQVHGTRFNGKQLHKFFNSWNLNKNKIKFIMSHSKDIANNTNTIFELTMEHRLTPLLKFINEVTINLQKYLKCKVQPYQEILKTSQHLNFSYTFKFNYSLFPFKRKMWI